MTMIFERSSETNEHAAKANVSQHPRSGPPGANSNSGKSLDAKPVAPAQVISAALLTDATIIAGSGLAGSMLQPSGSSVFTVLTAGCVAIATIGALGMRWAYTIPALMRTTRQIAETGLWLFCALSALVMLQFLLGHNLNQSRGWIAYWFAIGWPALVLSRLVFAIVLKNWAQEGRLVRRTVIAGGGQAAADLIARLEKTAGSSIHIAGMFDDRGADRSPEVSERYPKIGGFDELADFCRAQAIDLIIVALPPSAEERIMHLLRKLWVLPVDIRIAAHTSKLKLRARAYNYIGDVPFLPAFDKPMSDWSSALKTIEDRVIAALALIALSPLFAIIALLVKLDSRGPVFFRQTRFGFNNEPIRVFKFRSMYADQSDIKASRLVTKDDPRVTRIGRFIRKTSIDELPQLFNVLYGELSLVGPRPHAMQAKAGGKIYDEVVEGYFARHKVKPGITGWAQINGWRGETDTVEKLEARVEHDLYYIENWSLAFDLYILFKTPLSLLDTKNAY